MIGLHAGASVFKDPQADEMTLHHPEREGEINTPTVCFFHFQFILVIITFMQDLSWKLMTGWG